MNHIEGTKMLKCIEECIEGKVTDAWGTSSTTAPKRGN